MRKRGFVIQPTIEDLLLGYGKLTLEGGIKNPKGAFSTVSNEAYRGGRQTICHDLPNYVACGCRSPKGLSLECVTGDIVDWQW